MRLRRLDLTRYGHFTDFSLDFGPNGEGKPDLHIIFGPNEAGKSTAFDAYLDLLFGISARSKYNFLHDYETMRIGASLELDQGVVDLVRIKRNRGDLISPGGDPINPTILARALDSIDRDQYRAMFSLDDVTIEEGGEDILASEGNLGELLFSAAAGLSDLGSVLEAARNEVDLFHKPRARKTILAEAKRQLKALNDQIRDIDVPASAYRRLKEVRDAAEDILVTSKASRDALFQRRARLGAMIDAIPLLVQLDETVAAISGLEAYPVGPHDALEEAKALKLKEVEVETELRQARIQLEEHKKARDGLAMDAAVLEISDELTVLLDLPRSRAQTAEEDLPKRTAEREGLLEELADALRDLGLEKPEDGRIPEAKLNQLENMATSYTDLAKRLAAAGEEEARSLSRLAEIQETESIVTSETNEVDLETLLSELEPEDQLARLEKALGEVDSAERRFKKTLLALEPWQGAAEDLGSITLSESEAQRLSAHWGDQLEGISTLKRELKDARQELARLSARLEEFKKDDAASVDEEAKGARQERDALWEAHFSTLNKKTASEFHTALQRDDALQEARLGFAERLAQLREIEIEVASAARSVELKDEELNELEAALAKSATTAEALMARLRLPTVFDPRDLPRWRSALLEAQDAHTELVTKRKSRTAAERIVSDAAGALRDALGIETDGRELRSLIQTARAEITNAAKSQAEATALRKALMEAKDEAESRTKEVVRLEKEKAAAAQEWEREAVSLPEALRDLDEFAWKKTTLLKLLSKLSQLDQLERRIEALKRDFEAFSALLGDVASRIGDTESAAPLVLAERLRRRFHSALRSQSEFESISKKIEAANSSVRSAEAELAAVLERMQSLAAPFEDVVEINTLDALVMALETAKKADDLRGKRRALEDQIQECLGVKDVDEARAILVDQDLVDLRGQIDALNSELESAEADYSEKIGDLRSAKDALERVGGDDIPAKLEERRQTLLLELEDRAKSTLRLQLGILAADQALAAYRDEHRSGMLADTEATFKALTNGAYSELQTQADGQKELLLALRERDGRFITVSEMSKGTRFQLYLALRLAGYRQYESDGTTLPFIADDIMETFDNTRTEAALTLLKQIATQGQALYFTHHEHVVELARKVCGDGLTVHEFTKS
ncbi:MAG: AAA family ATPase [Pseudomonadota bacterium]